jgi:hypothetical protein
MRKDLDDHNRSADCRGLERIDAERANEALSGDQLKILLCAVSWISSERSCEKHLFLHSKVFELRAGFSISLAATPDAHLVGPRIACRVAIFDSCLPASRRAPSVPPAIADLATQP